MKYLIGAAGGKQTSLQGRSVQHIGHSVPFRRESITTITHLMDDIKQLMEFAVIQGVGLSDLGNSSDVDGPFTVCGLALFIQSLIPVVQRHLGRRNTRYRVCLPPQVWN